MNEDMKCAKCGKYAGGATLCNACQKESAKKKKPKGKGARMRFLKYGTYHVYLEIFGHYIDLLKPVRALRESILFVLALAVFASPAHAKPIGVESGKCYQSFPFGYVIVGKAHDNVYILKGIRQNLGDTQLAFLKTHKTKFNGVGGFQLMIKHVGSKKVKSDNGFDELYEVWEECQ